MLTVLGSRIRELRKEKGMTLEDVAKVLNISRQTMSRYETGVITNIPYDTIETLGHIFEVSPSYIMGWRNRDGSMVKSDLHDLPEYDADGNKLEWTDEEYKRADLLNEMETVDVAKYEAIKAVIDAKCDSAMLASVIEKCSDKEDEKLDKIIKLIDLMV